MSSSLEYAFFQYQFPIKIDARIPKDGIVMVGRQYLSTNGELTADSTVTIAQPAQVFQICCSQAGAWVQPNTEFSIIECLFVTTKSVWIQLYQ